MYNDFFKAWEEKRSSRNVVVARLFLIMYAPIMFLVLLPLIYLVGLIIGLSTAIPEKRNPHTIAMEFVTEIV